MRIVHVDDHPLDGGDHVIAGKRVLPLPQRRVAYLGIHQEHLADAALVLLEGGDLLRVRRPEDDGPLAPGPAGVVGGVTEVLDTILGELRLFAGGHVAIPQVVFANEDRAFMVGRDRFVAPATAASTPAAPASPAAAARGRRRAVVGVALRARDIAFPAAVTGVDRDALTIRRE